VTSTDFHTCKCGTDTYSDHIKKAESGQAAPHVYTGYVSPGWQETTSASDDQQH
jgi:hypothetical protein